MHVTADIPDRDDPTAWPGPSGIVELIMPAGSDLLVLARLAVANIASRSGFDIEEIDDLRLAVDELCLSVLDGRRRGRLVLRYDGVPDEIEVRCHYEGDDEPTNGGDVEEGTDGLSGRILDALVDEHGPIDLGGWHGARLVKRRAARDA